MKPLAATVAAAVIGIAGGQTSLAQEPLHGIGLVIMHGKGGSPARYVSGLASWVEQKGSLVANLEMPWSGNRQYDVSVAVAEKEVDAALESLRSRGAKTLFVAGHSQGGLFALYFGGRHPVDGIIAIAPGGNVASPVFQEKLGPSIELARRLAAEGRNGEKAQLMDYESSRDTYTVFAPPSAYLTWFDPNGAMNEMKAVKAVNPHVPVLFIVPTRDYPVLLRIKQTMFDALPKNPRSRLYEPDSGHFDAPYASREEIARWIVEVAGTCPASPAE